MTSNLYPAEPRIRWDYSQLNELLLWATHSGMSDLCLRSGLPAWMRLNGSWRQITQRPITTDELLTALERLTKTIPPRRKSSPASRITILLMR